MHETNLGGRIAILTRLLLVAVAGTLLPAATCDDNLGEVDSGPVAFRASVGTGNLQALGASTWPSSSRDGRYLAFLSTANNIAIPSSAFTEIMVRDRQLDTVRNATRLSRLGTLSNIFLSDCIQPAISPNGVFLVFLSKGLLTPTFDTDNIPTPPPPVTPGVQLTTNAYLFDLTQDLSNDPSFWFTPVIGFDRWPTADIKNVSVSDDGKVAFETAATNVPRTGFPDYATGGNSQVYVWNALFGTNNAITLISHDMAGPPEAPANNDSEQPRISGNGQFVAFSSRATNLTADPMNSRRQIFLSASDGTSIEFVSRATGAAGATSDEHCGNPCPNLDGSVVAFCVQNNVVGPGTVIPGVADQLVVRRNVVTDETDLVGLNPFLFSFGGPAEGVPMGISDDGQIVAWLRVSQDDANIIARDMARGVEFNASFTLIPKLGVIQEFPVPALSGDGNWVFWTSEAEVQVLNDTNNAADVFGFGPMR